jgi:hypothetical protein
MKRAILFGSIILFLLSSTVCVIGWPHWSEYIERAPGPPIPTVFYSFDYEMNEILNFYFDFNKPKDLKKLIAMMKSEEVWGNKYRLAACIGGIEAFASELEGTNLNPLSFEGIVSNWLCREFEKADDVRKNELLEAFELLHNWSHMKNGAGKKIGENIRLQEVLRSEQWILVRDWYEEKLQEMNEKLGRLSCSVLV